MPLPQGVSPRARAGTIEQNQPEEVAKPDFTVTRVAGPFNYPWSVAFLPDGLILVTERWGDLKLIVPGEPEPLSISGTPDRLTADHAGLMDVVLDPEFVNNDTIYLSYTYGTREAATIRVFKARLDVENLSLEEGKDHFRKLPAGAGDRAARRTHGDRPEWIAVPHAGRPVQRQARAGSQRRLRQDHQNAAQRHLPGGQPIRRNAERAPGIWSYGHRNPQGLAFDAATGQLWEHEHGPKGGDEFNLIQPGRNYGWPVITYGVEYSGAAINNGLTEAEGMEQPVHFWVPSIAPSGLTLYHGHVADWQHTAWLGALAGQMLVRLKLENGHVVTRGDGS